MNKTNMKIWVKALKSGKYKQIVGELRDFDRKNCYCALGVCCAEYEKSTKKKLSHNSWTNCDLPTAVQRWLGVKEDDPRVGTGPLDQEHHITSLNDAEGWSFKKIAKALENHFELNKSAKKKKK